MDFLTYKMAENRWVNPYFHWSHEKNPGLLGYI